MFIDLVCGLVQLEFDLMDLSHHLDVGLQMFHYEFL